MELTGKIFGRLTVISRSLRVAYKTVYWDCLCVCGTQTTVQQRHLNNGHTQSCGCFKRTHRITHGKYLTATYKSWTNMKTRCSNPAANNYNHYGGRGIKVCDRWLDSFDNFFSDMGEKPHGKTLDRKDVNGNYEPGNCQWGTRSEQNRNTQRTIRIEVDGQSVMLIDEARRRGFKYADVWKRFRRGLSVDKIFA